MMSADKNSTILEQIKLFSIGVILGCFGGIIWQELLSPLHITPGMTSLEEYSVLKSDTDERLLKYIEGRWRSSIGDLLININDSEINGSFIVIENIATKPTKEEKYKIVEVTKVDGFFGLVSLKICNINSNCNNEDKLPIQINKVFGIDKTIAITYDTRLSYCLPVDNHCTRAFKLIETD
jgi:hypothetical protein